MAVFPDLGFRRVCGKVVFSVDAHKVHQTDTDGVFRAEESAPRTKDTVPTEFEFIILIYNVVRGAIFYAEHTADAQRFFDAEEFSVQTDAGVLDQTDSVSDLGS